MNFLVGGDTYLWLYINFQNQINVGIRVLKFFEQTGKMFFRKLEGFILSNETRKKIKSLRQFIKSRDIRAY